MSLYLAITYRIKGESPKIPRIIYAHDFLTQMQLKKLLPFAQQKVSILI